MSNADHGTVTLEVVGEVDMDAIYQSQRLRFGREIRKGKPTLFSKALRKYGVTLDSRSITRALKIGNGNISSDIRIALGRAA